MTEAAIPHDDGGIRLDRLESVLAVARDSHCVCGIANRFGISKAS